ncbi:MAG: hypothetical protein PF590_07345 [Candidatus Delongbacteria bacterium]|jgi:hypothetical protein|nr:hypothetical protein [Candidatus Delongbacteria bacterium]
MKHIKTYWFIFVLLAFIACNSNEDEYTIIFENTENRENSIVYESGRLVPVDDISVDAARTLMLSLLDTKAGEAQSWLMMEAETYCESYDIKLLKTEYRNYPYQLKKQCIKYKDKKGNVHRLDVAQITKSYSNGFLLMKPDSPPAFMPCDTSSMHFDAPAAEAYFQFTYDDDKQNNINYSAEDYIRMFHDMKSTINETYNFNDITIQMGSRNFDLQLETGLSNRAIVEFFYTFKYLVENDQPEMIAHNMISYPLKVISGNKSFLINTPNEFISEYKGIIKTDLKNTIENSTVFHLKSDKAGFMLNDGNVYFKNKKEEIMITHIKNNS